MNDPVFLLSSERSGSNLLRVIMDSHHDFSAPHSPHLIKTFVPLLAKYGDLRIIANLTQLAEDMRTVINIQLRDWPFVPTTQQVVAGVDENSFSGLIRSIYRLAAENEDKTRSFIKDNGAIPLASELATLFPDSKFIYLVRDARDVALSWKKSPGHPGGVKEAAKMWLQEQTDSLYFLSLVYQTDKALVIRYENLVANPKREIEKICQHIEAPFDENMLKFYEGKEAKTSANAAVGWKNLTKPILADNTAKYKTELSRRELRQIESIAAVPLKQLGYPLEFPISKPWFAPSTIGKLYRAGQVAIKQLLRGREGIAELKQRTKRLSGLREIMNRKQNDHPDWSQTFETNQNESDGSQ